MSSSSAIKSTWGKFLTKQAAETTVTKLKEAGIKPEKIVVETENFQEPVQLEDTEAISNLKAGAIAGAVLGALIGLSISLVLTNFADLGLAAISNFRPIHYFSPVMGAIVGAAGMSLISGLSGASVLKANAGKNEHTETKKYLVVVEGTAAEISLTREIIAQQGGVVEEADRR
ncbi:MAG TPA: hypothetical protein V6C71_26640 [Coleofasciculaceae cyanobacterium]|jgi:hypothetical protein